jgi:hypothetical protein
MIIVNSWGRRKKHKDQLRAETPLALGNGNYFVPKFLSYFAKHGVGTVWGSTKIPNSI